MRTSKRSLLITDRNVLPQTETSTLQRLCPEPANANVVVPWSSDGKTVTQILCQCQSLIGIIISIVKYFSNNNALKSYLLL